MGSLTHVRATKSAQQKAAIEAREAAANLYARRLYRDVIMQMDGLSMREIADHLNKIQAPRLRGSDPWTADSVSSIRARVASLKI